MTVRGLAAAVLLALVAAAAPCEAQRAPAQRFFIEEVGDSTFTITVSGERWVRPGIVGTAVDPLRRDSVVARFRIIRSDRHRATALVTGQVADVLPSHVALLPTPEKRWYARRSFWVALLLGGAIGSTVTAGVR